MVFDRNGGALRMRRTVIGGALAVPAWVKTKVFVAVCPEATSPKLKLPSEREPPLSKNLPDPTPKLSAYARVETIGDPSVGNP